MLAIENAGTRQGIEGDHGHKLFDAEEGVIGDF
jgi:hypothetical protein